MIPENNATYCSLPWTHLATHPHGGVTLCCVSDHTNSMNRARNYRSNTTTDVEHLDLNNHRIIKIVNSDYFRETRLKMLAGKEVEACKRCYKEEASGVRSKRIEENERLNFTLADAHNKTHEDGAVFPNFKFVELRLGNLCNVKCRTCNPASSTAWATEYSQLQQTIKFVTKYDYAIDASWTESDAFWDDLLSKSNNLELLYINGGEPTLVEKHWKYLQRLIDAGLNKQITLWYNINMTNLPEKLLELWKQFKAVKVSCSIDELEHRNEYLRTGTKWSDVLRNLDKLQSLPWIDTSVCQTVSWMNAFTLKDFHNYMKARNLPVYMNMVHDPDFLSVSVLGKDIIESIISQSELDEQKNAVLRSMILPTDHTSLLAQGFLLQKGREYAEWLDKSRGTSYNKVYSNNGI